MSDTPEVILNDGASITPEPIDEPKRESWWALPAPSNMRCVACDGETEAIGVCKSICRRCGALYTCND